MSEQQVSVGRSKLLETHSNLLLRLQPNLLALLSERRAPNSGATLTQPATDSGNLATQVEGRPEEDSGRQEGEKWRRRAPDKLALRVRCLSRLALEYAAESGLILSGGKLATSKRHAKKTAPNYPYPKASFGAEDSPLASSQRDALPTPLSLLDAHSQADDSRLSSGAAIQQRVLQHMHHRHRQAAAETPPVYRWPATLAGGQQQQQAVGQRHQQARQRTMGDEWAELAGWTNQTRAKSVQPHASNMLVVWTSRQLRNQAEHIDKLLKLGPPNQLEAPLVEARTLPAAAAEVPSLASGENSSAESEDSLSAGGELSGGGSGLQQREPASSGENEMVQFSCFGRQTASGHQDEQEDLEQVHKLSLRWFLNGHELSEPLINSFNGSRFGFNNDPRARLRARSIELRRGQAERELEAKNGVRFLLLELTPELLQLKELNLKCRSVIEHTLIEYESQWAGQLSPGDSPSPYIQALGGPSLDGQLTPAEEHGHQMNNRMSFRRHNGTNPARQQVQQQQVRDRKRYVIRMNQSSASSSSSPCFTCRAIASSLPGIALISGTLFIVSSLLSFHSI